MKISTKGDYAIQLMLDLACNNTGIPVSLKDIAKRQGISEKSSEQIMNMLAKAGLIKSFRGAQGGYLLALKPEACTVGMVLRVTEGNLAPTSSAVNADLESIEKPSFHVTQRIWGMIGDAINNVVDNITLATLVEWQKEKIDEYYI